jgi:hypothetical protein
MSKVSKTRELQLKRIQELKQEPAKGTRISIGDTGRFARVRIPGRGEEIFYQEDDRALLFDIVAVYDKKIAMRTIKRWDSDEKVTEDELRQVIERVAELLLSRGWNPEPGWKE